jgi:hypothetical protein
VGRAVLAYEEALAAEPLDDALRFKLIEALYFQGQFATEERKTRKAIFSRALELAEEIATRIDRQAGAAAAERLEPERRAERLRGTPAAAPAHFWAAITWGLWGLSHGHAAAARRGVAAKIRDHAQLAASIDPAYRDAGGLRILGRLHTVTPHVPFFTGWIDRKRGIAFLEGANALSARDARNPLFLAEALLDHAPERRDEARHLLRDVAARQPDPSYLVEETETIDQARRRLAALEGPE